MTTTREKNPDDVPALLPEWILEDLESDRPAGEIDNNETDLNQQSHSTTGEISAVDGITADGGAR